MKPYCIVVRTIITCASIAQFCVVPRVYAEDNQNSIPAVVDFRGEVLQALRGGVLAEVSLYRTVKKEVKEPDKVQRLPGLKGSRTGGLTVIKRGGTKTVYEQQLLWSGLVYIRGMENAIDGDAVSGSAWADGVYEYTTVQGAFKRVRAFKYLGP
jgi:hypothetical protein